MLGPELPEQRRIGVLTEMSDLVQKDVELLVGAQMLELRLKLNVPVLLLPVPSAASRVAAAETGEDL